MCLDFFWWFRPPQSAKRQQVYRSSLLTLVNFRHIKHDPMHSPDQVNSEQSLLKLIKNYVFDQQLKFFSKPNNDFFVQNDVDLSSPNGPKHCQLSWRHLPTKSSPLSQRALRILQLGGSEKSSPGDTMKKYVKSHENPMKIP